MNIEFGITSIGFFVGMINQGVKYLFKDTKIDINRWLPVLSVVFGILLGIIGYFTPDVDMGGNILTAIFVGAASGSSATCIHQIYKQTTDTSSDESVEDEAAVDETEDATSDEIPAEELDDSTTVEETVEEASENVVTETDEPKEIPEDEVSD